MKPDTYDTIIDTTKELFGYSGYFILISFVIAGIMVVVYFGFFQLLEIKLSLVILAIINLITSFLIIIFMFMVKKTYERFKVRQWRDYWMGFGHSVEIPSVDNRELKEWLDENTPRLYRILERRSSYGNKQTLVFKHKKDAVACKLKWI